MSLILVVASLFIPEVLNIPSLNEYLISVPDIKMITELEKIASVATR
jgi:hypothetical protein